MCHAHALLEFLHHLHALPERHLGTGVVHRDPAHLRRVLCTLACVLHLVATCSSQWVSPLHFSPSHSGKSRVWLALRHALAVAQIWSRCHHRRPTLFRAGRSCAHDPYAKRIFEGSLCAWREAQRGSSFRCERTRHEFIKSEEWDHITWYIGQLCVVKNIPGCRGSV